MKQKKQRIKEIEYNRKIAKKEEYNSRKGN
jgi:hypothetical protein